MPICERAALTTAEPFTEVPLEGRSSPRLGVLPGMRTLPSSADQVFGPTTPSTPRPAAHGRAAIALTQRRLRGGAGAAGRGSGRGAADPGAAAEGVPGLGAHHAVHADAGGGLQGADRRGRGPAEAAVDRDRRAGGVELLLEGPHRVATVALAQLGLRGRGARGTRGGARGPLGAGQGAPRPGADHAVHADAGGGLLVLDGAQGSRAEDAVGPERRAVGVESFLEVLDRVTAGAETQLDGGELGLGGRREGRGGAADGAGHRRGGGLGGGRGGAGEGCGGGDGADDGGAPDTLADRGGEPAVVDHGT